MLTDFCDNINELDEHLADKLELYNERFTDLLPVSKRFKRFADYLHLKVWAFIFFVSIACALNGCAINYLGTTLMKGTNKIQIHALKSLSQVCIEWPCHKPSHELSGINFTVNILRLGRYLAL